MLRPREEFNDVERRLVFIIVTMLGSLPVSYTGDALIHQKEKKWGQGNTGAFGSQKPLDAPMQDIVR